MNKVSDYCLHCGNLKKEYSELESGVIYSYMIYLRSSYLPNNNSTSISSNWDIVVSSIGKNSDQAISNLPQNFHDWFIVKIDGPQELSINSNITTAKPLKYKTY